MSASSDLRYALRTLRRTPGMAFVVILILALGIAGNTALFSVVHAVLLSPLPYPDPQRLVMLWETHPIRPQVQVNYLDYQDWRAQSHSFEQIGAYLYRGGEKLNLTGEGEPEQLQGTLVSENLFSLLGASTVMGRLFRPDEDRPGHDHVVLLSQRLWRTRFAADPHITGKSIHLNGESFVVVGVLSAATQFPTWADVWLPLSRIDDYERHSRKHHLLEVIGRLRCDVPLRQAQTELAAIAHRLEQDYPATNRTIGVQVVPLTDAVAGRLRPVVLVLLAAVALVLLIACANVANLQLARATARQKEVAVRTALGASRARLVRQFLTESLLLSLLGSIAGVALASLLIPWLAPLGLEGLPGAHSIGIHPAALLFTLAVAAASAILFGLAPALSASRTDLNRDLKDTSHASSGPARRRAQRLLVVAEVALALVVLVGAGLLVRSFRRVLGIAPGFRPEGVLTLKLSLPPSAYPTGLQVRAFYDRLLPRLHALPGVSGVALIDSLPFSTELANWTRFRIEGVPDPEPGRFPVAQSRAVSPDYFRLMGIPLLHGRTATEADLGKPLVLVSQSLARRFFAGHDAVGRRLIFGGVDSGSAAVPIIGIVGDVRQSSPEAEPDPTIYFPGFANPDTLVIRTAGLPLALSSAVRRTVLAVDPNQPVYEIQSMSQIVDAALAGREFSVFLLSAFSFVALLLAALGIYGVMACSVAQRTFEIGIRLALGAPRAQVFRMVLWDGMRLAAWGILMGLPAAWFAAELLPPLLYGVTPLDWPTYLAVPVFLAGVALAAAAVPALRATRLDPLAGLRAE